VKVSLSWLREFIDISIDIPELADRLTMQGLAVEEIEHILPDIRGVITARVTEVKKHPNADRLSLCMVDTGEGSPLKVVCGASNVEEGGLYPFAPTGTRLPGGMEIREAEIRGELSSGMLCSGKELEIGVDGEGILRLDDALPIGADLVSELGLEDYILDIDVTANRFDLLSHIGIAREIGSITGNHIRLPDHAVTWGVENAGGEVSVDLLDREACPRYMACVIKGVKVTSSPFRLARRLETLGLRTVNNVVDVSNYVLMELGHPLHTFDSNLLKDDRIVVRRASERETIETLDGEKRELGPEDLVIADLEKPVAIAGVMGGLDTEVTDSTTDVFVECAHFNPVLIRRTSRRLALQSQASFRFERWVDPNSLSFALDRAVFLLQAHAGGVVSSGRIDEYPEEVKRKTVCLRPARADKLLGTSIDAREMAGLLEGIDLPVNENEGEIEVDVPTFRQDLTEEVDLIEEIARLVGYDRFDIPEETGSRIAAGADKRSQRMEQMKMLLAGQGFREVYTASFLNAEEMALLFPGIDTSTLWSVRNPISSNTGILRHSLLPGLIQVLKLNANRNNPDLRIFESGTVFNPMSTGEQKPQESTSVAGLISGGKSPVHWTNSSPESYDFFDLKGMVEFLFKEMGTPDVLCTNANRMPFHPGRCSSVTVSGVEVGCLGELHPSVCRALDLRDVPFLFELDTLCFEATNGKRTYIEVSSFPSVKRDLSLLVPNKVTHHDLETEIRDVCGDLLEELTLYDVYSGRQVPDGSEALTFALVLRSRKRTLNDREIEVLMGKVMKRIEKELGVTLRPMEGK